MSRRKKSLDLIRVGILFIAVIGLIAALAKYSEVSLEGAVQVIDGDSLKLGDQEIRLFGVDAPEYRQTCQSNEDTKPYNCGQKSREHLVGLTKGRRVQCAGFEKDKYERLLANCHADGIHLNAEMVRSGWAVAYGSFMSEQNEAEAERRGIWRGTFEVPADWRKEERKPHQQSIASSLVFW